MHCAASKNIVERVQSCNLQCAELLDPRSRWGGQPTQSQLRVDTTLCQNAHNWAKMHTIAQSRHYFVPKSTQYVQNAHNVQVGLDGLNHRSEQATGTNSARFAQIGQTMHTALCKNAHHCTKCTPCAKMQYIAAFTDEVHTKYAFCLLQGTLSLSKN